MQMESN